MRRLLVVAGAFAGVPILLIAAAPRVVTRSAAALFPGCLYEVPVWNGRRLPLIALTIDDAPDPGTTPEILDTLRVYEARATFFVITSQLRAANGAPDPLLARMRREGHEVGNHLTQDRPAVLLDSAAFDQDLARADSALREHGPLRWARPGSGWYSPRMVRAMKRAGYECALGSIYPFDATFGGPRLSARYILAHARPGSVVILHDRGERGERTAAVLGRVLPALRGRGYRIVTLSELAEAAR